MTAADQRRTSVAHRRVAVDMSPSFRRRRERPPMKTPDDVMTLTEHLGELRVRIIRSALAVILFGRS